MKATAPWIVISALTLLGCGESGQVTDPLARPMVRQSVAPEQVTDDNGAITQTGTFRGPFPPNPAVPYFPVPAECLNLGEPLHMSGIWSGWYKGVLTSEGHQKWTEQIDWSEVTLTLGDLTWQPAPAAYELITESLPATSDDYGDAAYVIHHQFTVRYVSQNGLPDLRVTHHVKQLLLPDLELLQNDVVMFSAECIGAS